MVVEVVDRASSFMSPGFLPVYSVATEQERDDLIEAAVSAGVILRQGPQLVSAHLAGSQTLPRLYAFGRQLQALHAGLLGREPERDEYDGPRPPVPPETGWFCPICDEFDTDQDLELLYSVDPDDDECPRCGELMDRVEITYCDEDPCPDPDEHHHGADGHLRRLDP